MAGSPWTCEQCGAANDPAAAACRICASPAPRKRSRALWILLVLMLVAAAAVGTTLLLAANHRRPPITGSGPFPAYTTPSLPPTPTVPVTTPAGITPITTATTTATTTAGTRPCPEPAAGYLPGGAGTALFVGETGKSVVTICQTPDGRIFYDGQARDQPASPDTHIQLPAERSGDGFVAANGAYRYTIGGGHLTVTVGERVLSDDALTPIG